MIYLSESADSLGRWMAEHLLAGKVLWAASTSVVRVLRAEYTSERRQGLGIFSAGKTLPQY